MNVLVFDIETIPDVAGLRALYSLPPELPDADVVSAAQLLRRQRSNGSDFLALTVQKVVTIALLLRSGDQLSLWSIGCPDTDEKETVQRFFDGIERFTPTLVSWNGSGFDLPVLHYRGMMHRVSAERYWQTGEGDAAFKWNNYISRYHERHTDVMDILSLYQGRAVAPLDDIATLLGYPGKMGMSGSKVWDAYQAGEQWSIRHYCETDVLNTYLVYLRFELLRGRITAAQCDAEEARLREYLVAQSKPHLNEFLAAWK